MIDAFIVIHAEVLPLLFAAVLVALIKEGVDDTYKFDAFGCDIAEYPDGCTVHLDNEEEAKMAPTTTPIEMLNAFIVILAAAISFLFAAVLIALIKEGDDDTYNFDAFRFDIAAYPDGCTVHLDNEEKTVSDVLAPLQTKYFLNLALSAILTMCAFQIVPFHWLHLTINNTSGPIPSNQSTPSTTVQSV
uniref:MARVEL domain-containing protein n=1 Tax=Panagrellus redivivus TaxID=6233 RepID=A0A7E4VH27_PANRE